MKRPYRLECGLAEIKSPQVSRPPESTPASALGQQGLKVSRGNINTVPKSQPTLSTGCLMTSSKRHNNPGVD